MKSVIWLLSLTLLSITACNKEQFPEEKDLQGSWTEITENEEKNRLYFEEQTLYFNKITITDTFIYHFDKKQGYIYLRLKNHPESGESYHEILINKKEGVLTIRNLFAAIPENTSVSKFNKD